MSILTHISLIRYHVHSAPLPPSASQKRRWPNQKKIVHPIIGHYRIHFASWILNTCLFFRSWLHTGTVARLRRRSFSCAARNHLRSFAYPYRQPRSRSQLKHLCSTGDGFVASLVSRYTYIYVYAQVAFHTRRVGRSGGWGNPGGFDAAQDQYPRLEPVSSTIQHTIEQPASSCSSRESHTIIPHRQQCRDNPTRMGKNN